MRPPLTRGHQPALVTYCDELKQAECRLALVRDGERDEKNKKTDDESQHESAEAARKALVREVASALRAHRLKVFDDWHAAGPEADDIWQRYEQERGRTFREALVGKHARMVIDFDRDNLNRASAAVLVMPAGKSGHIELG